MVSPPLSFAPPTIYHTYSLRALVAASPGPFCAETPLYLQPTLLLLLGSRLTDFTFSVGPFRDARSCDSFSSTASPFGLRSLFA